jgi:hypothetical protein
MKMKNFIKKWHWRICMMTPIMIVFCLGSCKDDEDDASEAAVYDPAQQVLISDFTPKTGGVGQRLVLYGKNFGNDPEIVDLFIGGKKARVIGVQGESLYCQVPEKAYSGEIEIRAIGENPVNVSAAEKFAYQRKMVVSTLFGYRLEDDTQPSGNFPNSGDWANYEEATLFKNDCFMRFDPKNSNHLYVGFDGAALTRIQLDDSIFQRVMTKAAGGFDRLRSVDFTLDGNYMILADDRGGVDDRSTMIASRTNVFTTTTVLTTYKQCNGASIHPVNGEMYFNSYEKGQVFRFDLANATYFGGTLGNKDYEELFKIQDVNWEFNIQIHPTGKYAYIVVVNQHYILRTDYNEARKRFNQPYLVCGEAKASGWNDAVGSTARLNRPYQGVFVKNPDYAEKVDEYDFYFADCNNHCIRILTPEGAVTTFAGRGSTSLNTSANGFVEGDLREEARFNAPTGLAYDEATATFYVGDTGNRRFRKIALEKEEEEPEEGESEE